MSFCKSIATQESRIENPEQSPSNVDRLSLLNPCKKPIVIARYAVCTDRNNLIHEIVHYERAFLPNSYEK